MINEIEKAYEELGRAAAILNQMPAASWTAEVAGNMGSARARLGTVLAASHLLRAAATVHYTIAGSTAIDQMIQKLGIGVQIDGGPMYRSLTLSGLSNRQVAAIINALVEDSMR